MKREILAPAADERVDRGVVPHIGAVATMAAKFDRVEVRGRPHLVNEHQLMLRTIERAHARIALVPEAEVQKLAIDAAAGSGDIVHVVVIAPDNAASVPVTAAKIPCYGEEQGSAFSAP